MNDIKIVCIGDSLTEGYNIEQSYRWSNLLASELNVDIINCGIGGDSTSGILARFKYDVIDNNPTHVLIMGGTNDVWYGVDTALIINNIHTMSRHAKHHNIVPIIGIPTPFYGMDNRLDGENYSDTLEDFKNQLRAFCLADEKHYIDFSLHMTKTMFLEDGLHPNEEGHRIMKENVKEGLKNIL